jgi:hypothetical protein
LRLSAIKIPLEITLSLSKGDFSPVAKMQSCFVTAIDAIHSPWHLTPPPGILTLRVSTRAARPLALPARASEGK